LTAVGLTSPFQGTFYELPHHHQCYHCSLNPSHDHLHVLAVLDLCTHLSIHPAVPSSGFTAVGFTAVAAETILLLPGVGNVINRDQDTTIPGLSSTGCNFI
jgi:hypothetical protein